MARAAQPPARTSGKDQLKHALEQNSAALAKAIPQGLGISVERVKSGTLLAYASSPYIRKCTTASIFQSVLKAAQLGLDPSGTMGEAYLVPYRDTCTLIVGYQGLITLARRSGHIVSLQAHCVYEQDEFDYELGLHPKLHHKPALGDNRGQMVCVYAVAHLKDGGYQFEVMSKSQVDSIRHRSKAGRSGPWKDHYDEMARKTAVRRLFKYLPKSVTLRDAMEHNDAVEYGDINIDALAAHSDDNVVDTTADVVTPEDRIPEDDFNPEDAGA